MTDGQTYYDGLIAQGYPADQALGYPQQYYPGFTPAVAAPAPMPVAAIAPDNPTTAIFNAAILSFSVILIGLAGGFLLLKLQGEE